MPKSTVNPKHSFPPRLLAKLRKLLAKKRSDLTWYHEIGQLVEQIVPDRNYGRGEILNLARLLGRPDHFQVSLYQMRDFARNYKVAQLSSLTGLRFVHIVALMAVKDVEERTRLEQQCIVEGMSVRQLRLKIQGKQGKGTAGGRRPNAPPKVGARIVVQEIVRESQAWLSKCPTWLRQNKARLAKMLERQNNAEILFYLDGAANAFAEVGRAARKACKTIKELQTADQAHRKQTQ